MFLIHWLLKWRPHSILMLSLFTVTVTFCLLFYYKHEIDEELMKTKKPSKKYLSQGKGDEYGRGENNPETSEFRGSTSEVAFRVVHLDLKGAPPSLSYLRAIFPMIAAAGGNALLIEYEDMFPYDGPLRNISALNAYTKGQVKEIIALAKENKLEIIPLVQTFGHLEFALKLQEFKYLRELDAFPQEVCPSNPDSLRALVFKMVDQVMEVHPGVKYLHIGCDEVYHLAACGRCTRRRLDARSLFTQHVTSVANHVRGTFNATPLVWDDMFRQWSPTDLADSGLGALVEPVVWVYIPDIISLVPHYVWHMYGKLFPNVWVASAFKGAFGETHVLPNIERHLGNHLAWIRLIRSKHPDPVQNFRGVVLTGWSRYDHFAVLCELLPPAFPSLTLNLLVVSRAFDARREYSSTSRESEQLLLEEVFQEWKSFLSCPTTFPNKSLKQFTSDPFVASVQTCSFPGSNLFASIIKYMAVKREVESFNTRLTVRNGWMTRYNIKHNFSSPWRVIEGFAEGGASGQLMVKEIENFQSEIAGVLTQYFDNFTVQEWIEQKIVPMLETMNNLENSARELIARNVWPRRPLTVSGVQ